MQKISIIIPVHNTGKFLEQSVSSVRNQTLKEIEIILVENASTDNSLELCKKIASEDDRIRVIHLDKGDLSTARNEGVKIASAEYAGFIDSDDLIDPTMYEILYTMAIENNLDVATCNYVKHYPSRSDKFQYCEDGTTHIVSPKEMVRLNMMEKIPQSACTMLVRKNILERIPFPAYQYFEDRFTTFKFFAAAQKCGYINKSFYHYYQYRGSICTSQNFQRHADVALADAERLKFIGESGMFGDDEKKIVAEKPAESLIRTLNRMRRFVSRSEERQTLDKMKKEVMLIPEGTKLLSLKAKILFFFFKKQNRS